MSNTGDQAYTWDRLQTAKRMVKQAMNAVWSMRAPRPSNRILYYHSVHPSRYLSHRPGDFAAQLDYLRENGYRSVLMRDIPALMSERTAERGKWVALTFDDGYRDNLQEALPVLKEAGFVATFFVVAGMVGKESPLNSDSGHMLFRDHPMLTREDLRLLVDEGMEVGSHGLSHRLATDIAQRSRGEFVAEIEQSRHILEEAGQAPVVSFSYPNGQRGAFSAETRRLLAETGCRLAATTMWGPVTHDDDLLALPRCALSHTDDIREFGAKLAGQRDYLSLVCRLRDGSKVWRRQAASGRHRSGPATP